MSETEVSAAELSLGSTKLSQNCVRLSNVQQNWVQTKQCQVKTEWGWTIPVKSKLKQKCPIWNLWVSNVRNSKWASPFKILYALLKMICFNDGILRKWNLRLLKSSMRFWKWNVSRTEYWENEILGFKNPLCASLKSFMRVWGWYISMMEGWENEIWDF